MIMASFDRILNISYSRETFCKGNFLKDDKFFSFQLGSGGCLWKMAFVCVFLSATLLEFWQKNSFQWELLSRFVQ